MFQILFSTQLIRNTCWKSQF